MVSVDDTDPKARGVQARLYAAMSAAEKLRLMNDLTLAANLLSLAGLRERYPAASEGELLLRLARVRLGDELVRRAYGELPSDT
jgi:hypothetical protein